MSMRCPTCKGTGEVPLKIQQECIGCQRKLMVEFESTAEMIDGDGRVYCADCKPKETP